MRGMGFGVVLAIFWVGSLLCAPALVRAEGPRFAEQIALKLARGAANFCTGWAELPKQVTLIAREKGWLVGLTRGTLEGLGMVGARTIAGAYEVLTFSVPVPPQYRPLLKPDYVWQPEPAEDQPPAVPVPAEPAARPDTLQRE
ncbi:exosortase system-associated protein, TIGR04073 family [Nitrospira sp. Kam-Ns4a]